VKDGVPDGKKTFVTVEYPSDRICGPTLSQLSQKVVSEITIDSKACPVGGRGALKVLKMAVGLMPQPEPPFGDEWYCYDEDRNGRIDSLDARKKLTKSSFGS